MEAPCLEIPGLDLVSCILSAQDARRTYQAAIFHRGDNVSTDGQRIRGTRRIV
jgi:hypothetical protein